MNLTKYIVKSAQPATQILNASKAPMTPTPYAPGPVNEMDTDALDEFTEWLETHGMQNDVFSKDIAARRAQIAKELENQNKPWYSGMFDGFNTGDYFSSEGITPSGFGAIGGGLGAIAGGLLPSDAPLWKRLLYGLGGAGLGAGLGYLGSQYLTDGKGWQFNKPETPKPAKPFVPPKLSEPDKITNAPIEVPIGSS